MATADRRVTVVLSEEERAALAGVFPMGLAFELMASPETPAHLRAPALKRAVEKLRKARVATWGGRR